MSSLTSTFLTQDAIPSWSMFSDPLFADALPRPEVAAEAKVAAFGKLDGVSTWGGAATFGEGEAPAAPGENPHPAPCTLHSTL